MNPEVKEYYTDEALKEACSAFDIAFAGATLIQANANLIYDCGDKILRLSHSCIRKQEDIVAELDWLVFLKERGLPVVDLLTAKSGNRLVRIGNDENHFTAVCFQKIDGVKPFKEYWTADHFKRLGKLTGALHREGQTYSQKPGIKYLHWDEIPEFEGAKYLPVDERKLVELHDSLVDEFQTYPKTKSNYGLIHYDIHQGNYLIAGPQQELILFDFEMACKSWYINDIATVLHYAAHHPASQKVKDFDAWFLEHFWQGYEEEYDLDKAERSKVPKFVLYRELLVYGFIHRIFASEEMRETNGVLFRRLEAFIERRRTKLGV